MKSISLLFSIFIYITNIYAENTMVGHREARDFNSNVKKLLTKVYNDLPRQTIYCQSNFNEYKEITQHNGYSYTGEGNPDLNNKIEWEHIVPAEFFGKKFEAWRLGDSQCVKTPSKKLSNRACAIKSSKKFQRIYTDLYNIYPAIAMVNRKRKNYKFITGDATVSNISKLSSIFSNKIENRQFGNCEFIIKNNKVIPSNKSKGIIARTYLYMSNTYKNECRLYTKEKQLFLKWSREYPVTEDECVRARIIQAIQGNENKIVSDLCKKANLYYKK